MPFHQHKLSNGLQIIGETAPSARSVAMGFFVRTGSRDETSEVAGVSHFLEHMLFKGTERRTAWDVNRDFDRIGSSANADTSEEMTTYHATVLPEYVPEAVNILADILRPSLRDEDFAAEKKVILEEIAMYEDKPSWAAYEEAKKLFFGGHPLGPPVLGSIDSITALSRDQMLGYFSRRYVAPNITFVVAGNFDWQQVVGLIGERCANWPAGPVGRERIEEVRGARGFRVVAKPKVEQEYVYLLSSAPGSRAPERYAADLAAMALGDDTGSRLYWSLVDPGLAESAETYLFDYEGTGVFLTPLVNEPESTQENLAIALGEMKKLVKEGLTTEELEQARNKALSRLVRGGERPAGRLRPLGHAWLFQDEYRSVDDEMRAYERVTLAEVRDVLDRYPLHEATVVAYGPVAELERP